MLLQGFYEAERLPHDFSENSPVPGFAYNILNKLGLLYKPIIDQEFLTYTGEKPAWPDGKAFAACLTHDVDDVSAYAYKQSLRAFRSPLNGPAFLAQKVLKISRLAKNLIQSCRFAFRPDPFHCYERWLEIEKKRGSKSTFFFWPGWSNIRKHHHTDCMYELHDVIVFDGQKCTVAEMLNDIHKQGWEIGLHPSWYAFNDVDELKRQKEALEKTLGDTIVSVRQHYLHYDIRTTPRVQSLAGFKYDSTLGFNDNIGFRFGTCYPWKLYDHKTANELAMVEIPLIIQDGALLSPDKGLRLDSQMALEYIFLLADRVKDVGGVLTLLWHPNEIINAEFVTTYANSLAYLNRQKCWMTTVNEIGDWWTQHAKPNNA